MVNPALPLKLNGVSQLKAQNGSEAARYLEITSLCELTCEFSLALDATTRAISKAEQEICDPRALSRAFERYNGNTLDIAAMRMEQQNLCLAFLVRKVANEFGWLEGWKCLAEACPRGGIPHNLLDDGMLLENDGTPLEEKNYPSLNFRLTSTANLTPVSLGVDVYKRVQVSEEPRTTIDLEFSVVSTPGKYSLNQTGLKTLGGNSWTKDSSYKESTVKWMAPEDLQMGPCPLYGWMAQCKKVQPLTDAETAYYFWSAQLLGIVDYDLDRTLPGGIINAINRTAEGATKVTGRMRGHGWTSLLTVDQQLFTRHMQTQWAREGRGSQSLGPANISPRDFAIAVYADCAALGPFACHRFTDLEQSRKTMFGAVVFASLHDLVFDIGYSSRISGVAYANATGVFKYDIPQAWLIGMLDGLATDILLDKPEQRALYGDNALFATAMWSIFNVRYRAWERFVKYTRLLRGSNDEAAVAVVRRAEDGMVILPRDIAQDLGGAWEMVVDSATASKLKPRKDHTQLYIVDQAFDDLVLPEICSNCALPFQQAYSRKGDEVYAVPGLPESVVNSCSTAIALAIRRVALWAIGPDCCDNCACILGTWANNIGDKVILALMKSEQELSNREWLLQNYFAGCVAFSPLRLMSITTGFDLLANVTFEWDAMGERDNISA